MMNLCCRLHTPWCHCWLARPHALSCYSPPRSVMCTTCYATCYATCYTTCYQSLIVTCWRGTALDMPDLAFAWHDVVSASAHARCGDCQSVTLASPPLLVKLICADPCFAVSTQVWASPYFAVSSQLWAKAVWFAMLAGCLSRKSACANMCLSSCSLLVKRCSCLI